MSKQRDAIDDSNTVFKPKLVKRARRYYLGKSKNQLIKIITKWLQLKINHNYYNKLKFQLNAKLESQT